MQPVKSMLKQTTNVFVMFCTKLMYLSCCIVQNKCICCVPNKCIFHCGYKTNAYVMFCTKQMYFTSVQMNSFVMPSICYGLYKTNVFVMVYQKVLAILKCKCKYNVQLMQCCNNCYKYSLCAVNDAAMIVAAVTLVPLTQVTLYKVVTQLVYSVYYCYSLK